MNLISRREFGKSLTLALGAAAISRETAWAKKNPNSLVNGVQIGIQSYSFRDRSFDEAINAIVEAGINSCELWQGHLEPKDVKGEALRRWRLTTPLASFEEAGKKLKDAGIQL